jgi:hypothetical protein
MFSVYYPSALAALFRRLVEHRLGYPAVISLAAPVAAVKVPAMDRLLAHQMRYSPALMPHSEHRPYLAPSLSCPAFAAFAAKDKHSSPEASLVTRHGAALLLNPIALQPWGKSLSHVT